MSFKEDLKVYIAYSPK